MYLHISVTFQAIYPASGKQVYLQQKYIWCINSKWSTSYKYWNTGLI